MTTTFNVSQQTVPFSLTNNCCACATPCTKEAPQRPVIASVLVLPDNSVYKYRGPNPIQYVAMQIGGNSADPSCL